MTRSLNQCQFVGRLTAEPVTTYLPSGAPVSTFSLAINSGYTNRQGERVEQTEFVDIKCWNLAAEAATNHLFKGSFVFLEGAFKTDKWTDKDTGQPRSRVFIVINDSRNIVLLAPDGRALATQPHLVAQSEAEAEEQAAPEPEPVKVTPVIVAPPTVPPTVRPAKNRPPVDTRPIRRTTRQPVAASNLDDDLPF